MSDREPQTITLSPATSAFYRGAEAASSIGEELADVKFDTFDDHLKLFWLQVGARMAAAGLKTKEEQEAFFAGVASRQPSRTGFIAVVDTSSRHFRPEGYDPNDEEADHDGAGDFLHEKLAAALGRLARDIRDGADLGQVTVKGAGDYRGSNIIVGAWAIEEDRS